jgi:hypothetical protein
MYHMKIAIGITAFALVATVAGASHRNWSKEAREPFHYTFSKDTTLDVDDVDGAIQVTGDNGNTIRVDGERIVHAEDQDAINRAKNEVKLDVNEKDGTAQLYVNGPFRGNRSSDDHGFHVHWDDHPYEVTYNFVIKVPRDIALRLRTVNGEIETEATRGKFDIRNVNGSVNMKAAGGSGTLHTVNGKTSAAFVESPKASSSFETVNGSIDTVFPANLSADVRVKTLNGQAYTDFESTLALPSTAQADQRSNGKFVYRSNRNTGLRIGSGGPELSFQTVNGDIRIKKEGK